MKEEDQLKFIIGNILYKLQSKTSEDLIYKEFCKYAEHICPTKNLFIK